MAAGLSLLDEEAIDLFRRRLNENCKLTDEDFEEIKKSLISKGLQGKALDETLDLVKEHGNLSSLRYYIREDIDPELFIFKVKYNAYDSLELIKRTFGDLLNKELYKKSEEFLKRGISIENSLILSFFTFSNEEEIDRACELVKKGVQLFEAQKYSRTIESFSTLMAKENEYGKIDDYDYKIYSTDNIVEIIKEIRKEGIKPEEWYELNSKDIKDSNKVQIIKELKKGATLEEAIEIVENAEIRAKTDECMLFGVDEKNATKWAKAALDKYSFLGSHTVRFLIEGVDFAYANELGMNPDGPKARKFYNLMQRKKYSPELAQIIATTGIEEPEKVELMKKLLDKSFIKNIQKRIQNPNIDENIDNIFNIRNMNSYKAADLLNCGLSAEEIADSIVKLAKSPLKSALKKPNQYLSHIPLKYTTKINGKYPRLQGKELKNLQEKIEEFFQSNPATLRAIKFLDNDTFNQMMDKRTADFEEILSTINTLTDENYRFVSELLTLKNSEGADLTAKDKIELCQTVTYLQAGKMVDDVKFVENNRLLPMDEIRKQVIQVALKTCDFTNQEIAKIPVDKLEFDKEYFSTIFQLTPAGSWEEFKKAILNQVKDNPAMEMELIKEVENYIENPELGISRGYPPEACEALLEIVSGLHTLSDREQFELYKVVDKSQNENNRLQEVLKGALLGDFKTFIHDTSNPFGKANQETKKVFEQKGINYNAWVNYQEQTSFELDNRTLTFKQWDRNPQKDLFIGNRTSCCTALNKTNGKSTPTYLANTAFNVVELKDNKDNTVMMARFVMAEVDSKPAIIIDTIELNNSFIKDLDLKNLKYKDMLRDKLFSYLKKYAKKLSKKPLPIYLSGSYLKVNNTGLEKVQKAIKLLGESSPNKFYLNAAKGWITQGEEAKQEYDFYEVN